MTDTADPPSRRCVDSSTDAMHRALRGILAESRDLQQCLNTLDDIVRKDDASHDEIESSVRYAYRKYLRFGGGISRRFKAIRLLFHYRPDVHDQFSSDVARLEKLWASLGVVWPQPHRSLRPVSLGICLQDANRLLEKMIRLLYLHTVPIAVNQRIASISVKQRPMEGETERFITFHEEFGEAVPERHRSDILERLQANPTLINGIIDVKSGRIYLTNHLILTDRDGDIQRSLDIGREEFAKEEIKGLRSEIGTRIQVQHQVLNFAVVAFGIVLGAVFKADRTAMEASLPVLLIYPILALFFAAGWVHNIVHVRHIGQYMRDLETRSSHFGWEHFLQDLRTRSQGGEKVLLNARAVFGGIFVVTQLLAMLLWLVTQVFLVKAPIHGLDWFLLLSDAAAVSMTVCMLLITLSAKAGFDAVGEAVDGARRRAIVWLARRPRSPAKTDRPGRSRDWARAAGRASAGEVPGRPRRLGIRRRLGGPDAPSRAGT